MATYTGIGAAFGGFFGAGDLEDAYNEALAEYQRYRETVQQSLDVFRNRGAQTYTRFKTALTDPEMSPDLKAMRSMLITNATSGLSPLAQLYMEDANRYLEGRAISTGNLRSGAIGLQRGELGRRVVADEFGRALTTLNTLRQGDIASADLLGRTALGYTQNENLALGYLGNAVGGIAGSRVGAGMAEYAQDVALGQAIGGLFDKGEEYAKSYFTGGTSNLMGGG